MINCPKCKIRSDFNQFGSEIVIDKCGHTFVMEYEGYYDENQEFHEE